MMRKPKDITELRKIARQELPAELRDAKPCRIEHDVGGETRVFSGSRLLTSFNRETLKRESPEHSRIVEALLEELSVQAQIAVYAVALATGDIAAQEKRAPGSKRGAEATAAKNSVPTLNDLIDRYAADGARMPRKEWAHRFGISVSAVNDRIERRKLSSRVA